MSFPRYPKYKQSGVEWLGEVPEHWGLSRLRFETQLNPSKSELKDLDRTTSVSFLPMEAIGDDGTISLELERPLSEVENGYSFFRDEDVGFAKITPCFENGKGAVFKSLKNGIGFGTTELTIARPRPERSSGRFIYYLFRSSMFRQIGESQMYGAGGQKRVSDSFVRDFKTAFPPLAEQAAIASFLDRETAKIDALIAEQQRLIELLQEKRQAVISHAVTKGLNPNVPMKDSGIEWLGEVPAHWEVCRVKAVSSFTTSGPRGWSENVGDIGSLFIQSGDLGDTLEVDFLNCKRVQIGPESAIEAERTKLNDGDVLVCVTGAKTGNVAVCNRVPEASYVNQHVCLVRPSLHVIPEFLGMVLKFGYGQTYLSLVQYGLKQGLSLENVRETPVILPPKEEQSKITRFVSHFIKGTSSLVIEAHRAIELLRERRSALISAAVTGQIDVRGLAPKEAA